MWLFNFAGESRTVREVLSNVEPMLNGMEAEERFDPSYTPARARRKSAAVFANDMFLLGFIEGLIAGFVVAFGGATSEKRLRRIGGRVMLALFPGRAAGLDLIVTAQEKQNGAGSYGDGFTKGAKLGTYNFGADYSGDPDALEAIRIGRELASIGVEYGTPLVKSERGDLIGGMQWMYFTQRVIESRRSASFG
jgi:hypothetical protein